MALKLSSPRFIRLCSRCCNNNFDFNCRNCRITFYKMDAFVPAPIFMLDTWTNAIYDHLVLDSNESIRGGTPIGHLVAGRVIRYLTVEETA
jgi:hypothetical protein